MSFSARAFRPLRTAASRHLRQLQHAQETDQGLDSLTGTVRDFVEGGWARVGRSSDRDLRDVSGELARQSVKRAIQRYRGRLDRLLSPLVDGGPGLNDEELVSVRDGLRSLQRDAEHWLMGIRLSGKPPLAVEVAGARLAELFRNAEFVLDVVTTARERSVEIEEAAPAAVAAVLADAKLGPPEDGLPDPDEMDPAELLEQANPAEMLIDRGLVEGNEAPGELRSLSYTFFVSARDTRVQVAGPFRETVQQIADICGRRDAPDIPVHELLSLEMRYRGAAQEGSQQEQDQEREEAAYRLARDQAGMAAMLYDLSGTAEGARRARRHAFRALERMNDTIRDANEVYREVQRHWRDDLEFEMRVRKRDVLPLSEVEGEGLGPREQRLMYYQDALEHDLPLGAVLAELRDSEITFGPDELEEFEHLAYKAAWEYVVEPAAEEVDQRLRAMTNDREDAMARLRGVLRDVEFAMRRQGATDPQQLQKRGRERFESLVEQELLTERQARTLVDVLPAMVDRIAAHQEVWQLSHLRAAEERVYRSTFRTENQQAEDADVGEYRKLPHSRRFAREDGHSSPFRKQRARNGQTFRALNEDTKAAWQRYRTHAPIGRDVSRRQSRERSSGGRTR